MRERGRRGANFTAVINRWTSRSLNASSSPNRGWIYRSTISSSICYNSPPAPKGGRWTARCTTPKYYYVDDTVTVPSSNLPSSRHAKRRAIGGVTALAPGRLRARPGNARAPPVYRYVHHETSLHPRVPSDTQGMAPTRRRQLPCAGQDLGRHYKAPRRPDS